ncbi:MAG: MogA/MoaB family molybdenum cofactor biosynthesis protein [Candidatus Rifleibacteriota bacterium]
MSHHEHEKMARQSLNVAVLTFSDTRDENGDKSGKIVKELLIKADHKIIDYRIVKEDPEKIRHAFVNAIENKKIDAVISNGGTGINYRDNTIEVAKDLFEKELEGFGEIFRFISFQQIGSASIMSRATAGVSKDKLIICLPGSSKAVKLAMARIVVPQLAHMCWEIKR